MLDDGTKDALESPRTREWDHDDLKPNGAKTRRYALKAVAASTIVCTVFVDDSDLYSRLTRIWLSNRCAREFKRRLATLVVHVSWKTSMATAPMEALSVLALGPADSRAPDRDLLGPHRLKLELEEEARNARNRRRATKRGAGSAFQNVALALKTGTKPKVDTAPRQRRANAKLQLRRRLLARRAASMDAGSRHRIVTYGARDARAVRVSLKSRGYDAEVTAEVLDDTTNDDAAQTAFALETEGEPFALELLPGKTTILRVALTDARGYKMLTTRRIARRWWDFRNQIISITSAVLKDASVKPSEDATTASRLVGGPWLFDGLKLAPTSSYVHMSEAKGRVVHARLQNPTTLKLTGTRPGYDLAGLSVTRKGHATVP